MKHEDDISVLQIVGATIVAFLSYLLILVLEYLTLGVSKCLTWFLSQM